MDDKKNIKTKDKKLSENKKTEDKSLGLEKKEKSLKFRKKKVKKNIISGIAYVNATFNNTIVSIADNQGNGLAWASAGAG